MHLTKHAHGKSRVRVARVWREGAVHHAVEWQCEVLLESDMAPAYLRGDNSDMTATDTIKNTVRSAASHAALHPTKAPAKLCTPCRCITWRSSSASAAPRSSSAWRLRSTSWRSTPRRGVNAARGQARLLAPRLALTLPCVSRRAGFCCGCHDRAEALGTHHGRWPAARPRHVHSRSAGASLRSSCTPRFLPVPYTLTTLAVRWSAGFTTTAPGTRMAYVLARRGKPTTVSAGLENLSVLKTTQSGYEGFGRGPLTSLPETRERMLATTLSATWAYAKAPPDYDAAYDAVMHGLCDTFFGPARGGVYSPGVQATLYAMGCAVLARVGAVSSISLALPNLHFLPTLPANIPFENDVYVATSEPHGSIMATVSRDRDSKFVARPRL